ncbi:MAG: hypothetical protein DMF12_10665 [Verrucomicrobia bacterium]|nr:MAG: hypothetical protein DMF12_10665 [Verrucomicrobiota bacterium]
MTRSPKTVEMVGSLTNEIYWHQFDGQNIGPDRLAQAGNPKSERITRSPRMTRIDAKIPGKENHSRDSRADLSRSLISRWNALSPTRWQDKCGVAA